MQNRKLNDLAESQLHDNGLVFNELALATSTL
jgi:hypothetical protein